VTFQVSGNRDNKIAVEVKSDGKISPESNQHIFLLSYISFQQPFAYCVDIGQSDTHMLPKTIPCFAVTLGQL